jgi:hypothetical protein
MKLGQSILESSTDSIHACKVHVSFTSPTLLDRDIIMISCVGLDKPRRTEEAYSPDEGVQEYTNAYSLTLVPRLDLPLLPSQGNPFVIFSWRLILINF